MKRGLSEASKKAKAYVEKNPEKFMLEALEPMSGYDVAKKFGLNPATVYRAEWWKTRGQKKEQV